MTRELRCCPEDMSLELCFAAPAAGGDIVRGADFVRAKPGYRSPLKTTLIITPCIGKQAPDARFFSYLSPRTGGSS